MFLPLHHCVVQTCVSQQTTTTLLGWQFSVPLFHVKFLLSLAILPILLQMIQSWNRMFFDCLNVLLFLGLVSTGGECQ